MGTRHARKHVRARFQKALLPAAVLAWMRRNSVRRLPVLFASMIKTQACAVTASTRIASLLFSCAAAPSCDQTCCRCHLSGSTRCVCVCVCDFRNHALCQTRLLEQLLPTPATHVQ